MGSSDGWSYIRFALRAAAPVALDAAGVLQAASMHRCYQHRRHRLREFRSFELRRAEGSLAPVRLVVSHEFRHR